MFEVIDRQDGTIYRVYNVSDRGDGMVYFLVFKFGNFTNEPASLFVPKP
jgi:hypothetical protein